MVKKIRKSVEKIGECIALAYFYIIGNCAGKVVRTQEESKAILVIVAAGR